MTKFLMLTAAAALVLAGPADAGLFKKKSKCQSSCHAVHTVHHAPAATPCGTTYEATPVSYEVAAPATTGCSSCEAAAYTTAPVVEAAPVMQSAPMSTGCSACEAAAAPVSYESAPVMTAPASSGCSACEAAATTYESAPVASSGCSACAAAATTPATTYVSAPAMTSAPATSGCGCK